MKQFIKQIIELLWKPLNIDSVTYLKGWVKTVRRKRKNKEKLLIQFGKKYEEKDIRMCYKLWDLKLFRIGLQS